MIFKAPWAFFVSVVEFTCTTYYDTRMIKNFNKKIWMEFFCLCCLWVQKEFNYVPNKPLRDSGHLYFRLSLNRGGRVWLREWWREHDGGRTGVPLWSQTQMDKMRGEHKHSWGLVAWSIIRPGAREPRLCTDDTGFSTTQSFTALTRNPWDMTLRPQLHQD